MIAVVDTSAVLRLFIPDGPIPDGLEAFFRGAVLFTADDKLQSEARKRGL
jgi:hypothetical protein